MTAGQSTEAESGQHQNIARATLVLQELSESGAKGLRLADVTRRTGLSKTAAHRCLAGLTAHGLAAFDERTSLFFIGDKIFEWFSAVRERFVLAERVTPYVDFLVDQTEDTVYFMVRRGSDAVCLARGEGRFPIKTLTLGVGETRPLGTNTGSLAIFSFLPDAEIDALLKTRTYTNPNAKFGLSLLRTMVAETRQRGYSWIDGHVMSGMSGVGIPLRDTAGNPVAAISMAAISSRLSEGRRAEIVALLKEQAARMEVELAAVLR